MKQAPVLVKDEYYVYHGGKNRDAFDKDFQKLFYPIDINNDGFEDFIYTGHSGGEGTEVTLILNTGKTFKLLFKQNGYLQKLEFKDNKLFRVFVVDYGCCLDYINFNKVYQLNYSASQVDVKVVYLTASINTTHLPKEYFDRPVNFEVLNNGYKMRADPFIDDSTKNDRLITGRTIKGNAIDTLDKGTKGRAIAAETDKTGRVWWLVEIDKNYTSYGDLFYEEPGNKIQLASKMGWISSRYVKKLDN